MLFDILALIFFAVISFFSWYDYFGPESHKMDLYGGIVFGLLAIIKIVEVIGHFVKKRELQSKKDKGY